MPTSAFDLFGMNIRNLDLTTGAYHNEGIGVRRVDFGERYARLELDRLGQARSAKVVQSKGG